ncbi:hypothetical protein V7S43_004047 [Phytophthora oleae]|uniref:Band 7 domain-containing protein n=1 Tax=Phytophthora oleae TaxID=2107226 RepID=A0ABD3FVB3_9STRA
MVDIDISISFQIGPTENDVYAFVYSLGAHRFDELLYSITEEAIRGLVHSVRHDQVHDLREEFAVGMKTDLNEKLKSFGVFIQNVKVTNVNLPTALAKTLEETTVFKTRMQEQEKNRENQMRILLNRETQTLTALEKSNERTIQDLQAKSVNAAEGLKDNALDSATARAVERKTLPSIELKNLQANYDRYVEAAKVSAEATIQAAEKQAAMILATADVEEASAEFLMARRNFDYNEKRIDVEASLLEAVPLVISGKNGDQVIQSTVLEAVRSTMN